MPFILWKIILHFAYNFEQYHDLTRPLLFHANSKGNSDNTNMKNHICVYVLNIEYKLEHVNSSNFNAVNSLK